MTVGVVGGTGLVGSHIAFALCAAGHTVRLAYRSEEALRHVELVFRLYGEEGQERYLRMERRELDPFDLTQLSEFASGCDAVVHAAAEVTLGSERHGALTTRLLAARVVDACLAAKVGGIVHLGSIAALPPNREGAEVQESAQHSDYARLGDYARGKSEAEREMLRGVAEGLRVAILNPGVVLAPPTRHGSSAKLVLWAQRGSHLYTTGHLAWVDVRDVADCVVRAVERGVPTLRCTLVGGTTSYRQFLDAFRSRFGGIQAKWPIPSGVAHLLLPALRVLTYLRVLPRGLNADTVRAGYNRERYSVNVVHTEFGLGFRGLEESISFLDDFLHISH